MKRFDEPTDKRRLRRFHTLPIALGSMLTLGVVGTASFALTHNFLPHDDIVLTVHGNDATYTYDGKEHSVSGIEEQTVSGVIQAVDADGKSYEIRGLSMAASGVKPSDSNEDVRIVGKAQVLDEHGNDVTEHVDLEREPGSLVIEPRELTLQSADIEAEFTGHSVSNGDTKLAVEDGFVDGDGASYAFSAQQTLVGTVPNTFKVIWDKGTDPTCYDVSVKEGYIRVNPNEDKLELTIEGKSKTVEHDYEKHSLRALKDDVLHVTVDDVNYDVTGVTSEKVTGTDVGTYTSKLVKGKNFGVYLVGDNERFDVTDQFDVKFVDGTLTITPGDVYVGTFFSSNDDWTDSVYVSRDCENFYKVSESTMDSRDPSIMWRDGRFWSISCRNDEDGHVWLSVSSSTDLITWTDTDVMGPFDVDELPDADGEFYNVVAPEWFQDGDKLYVIISCGWWGENHGEPTNDHMQSYIMEVTDLEYTDDVTVLDGTGFKKLSVNEDGGDRIDGTIDKVGDTYYLTIKRNGLSTELWSNTEVSETGWKRVDNSTLYGYEGNCVVEYGKRFSMFADGVPDVAPYGVKRWVAKGLDSKWEPADVKFFDTSGEPIDVVRHGTVIAVSPDCDAYDVVTGLLDSVENPVE